MIECHVGVCENHICHTDANEGPFCSLDKCEKTSEEIIAMLQEGRKIPVYNFIPEEEKIMMREFMTVWAVIFAFMALLAVLSWVLS